MRAFLAFWVILAWPALGQEFTVKTTMVKPLTGPESPSEMQRFDICGTDLGTMAELDGTIVLAFGDTFGFQGDSCQRFGGNFRSNVIGFTTDMDPSDGVVIEDWLAGADGRAIAAVEGRHDQPFTGEFTKIPTAMVAIGDTLYLHYMSVKGFDFSSGFAWLCNHSRFIVSKDGGRTWVEGKRDFGDYQSTFNMLALSAQSGAGNAEGAYVYAIGTPCGQSFGARVGRVPVAELEETEAWEYWDGAAWTKDRAQAAEVIKPGVAMPSLAWNAGIGRWMLTSLNGFTSMIELRFAERPEGPWSDAVILADWFDYVTPYGAFMTPSWISEDGLRFYFVMSQFGRYNTFVMKAELERRTE
jgi:hypothetical protein